MIKFVRLPKPATVDDCILLWQMGYDVQIDNGRISSIEKKKAVSLELHSI